MKLLLQKSNRIYKEQPCCHSDGRVCNCLDCFGQDYFEMPDSYECLKKLCYYTMYYGPILASEIYHYLSKSRLLENQFNHNPIRILSLGCGFSPEIYALEKYINDQNIQCVYDYTGYDSSYNWGVLLENKQNRHYKLHDIKSGFSLEEYE